VTTEGPHQLSGRCPPLISGDHTFILAAGEILRGEIHVSALDEIEIQLDERPRPLNTSAVTAPRRPCADESCGRWADVYLMSARRMGNLNEWLGPWPVCTTVCLHW
jgi:hypothetical protein